MEVLFLLEFVINSDSKFILNYNYLLYFIGLVFVSNCILEEMSNLAIIGSFTYQQLLLTKLLLSEKKIPTLPSA